MIKDCFITTRKGNIYNSESMRSDTLNLRGWRGELVKVIQIRNVCFIYLIFQQIFTEHLPSTNYSLDFLGLWLRTFKSLSEFTKWSRRKEFKGKGSGRHNGMESNIHRSFQYFSSFLTLSFFFFLFFQNLPVLLPVVHHRMQDKLFGNLLIYTFTQAVMSLRF